MYNKGNSDAEIRDGMSYTLALSEVLGFDSSQDARGVWVANSMGSTVFTAHTLPNARGPYNFNPLFGGNRDQENYDHIPMCEEKIPADEPLHCIENQSDGKTWAAARSAHQDGVNVIMADSSARFVSDRVDIDVWRAASTRAGGIEEEKKLP